MLQEACERLCGYQARLKLHQCALKHASHCVYVLLYVCMSVCVYVGLKMHGKDAWE